MSTKSLIKPIGTTSLGIASSRLLGFVRDILMAGFFGTGSLIQAFIVAFRIPNLLRETVGEGASNAAFVPVLSEYLACKDKEDYWRLAQAIFNMLSLLLIIIVAAGIMLAPIIVKVIAPGFGKEEAGQLDLAVSLTRIIFPYIFLIGLTALASGVLNSLNHFAAPAFGPCLLNISIIVAILIYYKEVNVTALAMAVLVGGVLQLALQINILYKKGMRIKFSFDYRHPALRKIVGLLIPRIFGSIVYQLNNIVDTMIASLSWIVGKGAIAALWYSYRLIQLPTAVFGNSVAIAGLPALSGHFAKHELDRFKRTISFSLKTVFLFTIPASVGFMVMGSTMLKTLFYIIMKAVFQKSQFGEYSVMITNQALFYYAIGLFSYAGIRILAFGFYSMQDTATPVKTAFAALFINIIFNVMLMYPLKVGGIALATSISGIFNFFSLFYILRKRIGPLNEKEILSFLIKVILASLFMGVILRGLLKSPMFISIASGERLIPNLTALVGLVAVGIFSYTAVLLILRLEEIKEVFRWIKKN